MAASRSNPGVPPGSLFSFLRAKPSVAAAALTDFDSAFRNHFYSSRFDNGSSADVGSVAAAAAVAARALHALASGPGAAPLQVQQHMLTRHERNRELRCVEHAAQNNRSWSMNKVSGLRSPELLATCWCLTLL